MNDTSDKYANFSHDELVAEINRLKKHKKYGLVWEHKTEKVIEDFETQQPYLEEVTDKRIEDAPGEPTNLIIEGDNFEALSILNYTHAGKVDVIYIDPPYNTGNKDFIYNDDYVDSEDEFRHSKWLSFMEPRLKLAKNLLKDDGVIFISIDDNEYAALKNICCSIFNEENVETLIWNKIGTGSSSEKMKQVKRARRDHEYIICCYLNSANVSFNKVKVLRNYKQKLVNKDNDSRGEYKLGSIARSEALSNSKSKNYYTVISPTGIKWTRQFLVSNDEFKRLDKDGRIFWGKNGDKTPAVKVFASEKAELYLSSIMLDYGSATLENKRLCDIFARSKTPFDNPKPVVLIKTIIGLLKKEAVVLDFFAGSGTTGQAVLELNKEDGGHRQFILCTNNGDKGPDSTKIAEEITYPRIKTVITGARQDGSKYSDGIPANLRYYKINHREKKPSIDANRQDIVAYMENIIQVKENAYKQLEINEDFAIYESNEKYVGLVFEPFLLEEVITDLKERNAEKRPAKLYVFSYSRDAFEDDYGADFEIEFVAMPEGLLKTYAHIVEEQKKEDL